jgi:hypothetical protein
MSDRTPGTPAVRLPSPRLLLAVLLLAFVGLAASAMTRTSATFDEITFPTAGARGLEIGDFGLLVDHPPVMQYAYGLPVWLMHPHYPPEAGRNWQFVSRYHYAQALLWGSRNYGDRLLAAARLVAVAIGALLVGAMFLLYRRALGDGGALLAASLVAFLPDVLAHSGVAYNDVPIALAILVAVGLGDRAIRSPSAARAALAGAALGLAVGVKLTGLVVLPILLVVALIEAWVRRDRAWALASLRGAVIFGVAAYLVLVAIYLGDFSLEALRHNIDLNRRLDAAHRPAFLLGVHSDDGLWYFYPVVFLMKTPAAFHALVLVALAGAWIAGRGQRLAELAAHPLRASAVALVVIGAGLLATKIDIGFRHALPALPFVCVLAAAGVRVVWQRAARPWAVAIALLVAADIASAAAAYPHYLSYLSEYVRGRPLHETLVDSSTDWGQDLVELRRFMAERGVDGIYLAQFGSALPQGYGIAYAALPSFLPLPDVPVDPAAPPRYVAISATLLAGLYTGGDVFAAFRARKPVAMAGRTFYVFDAPGGEEMAGLRAIAASRAER